MTTMTKRTTRAETIRTNTMMENDAASSPVSLRPRSERSGRSAVSWIPSDPRSVNVSAELATTERKLSVTDRYGAEYNWRMRKPMQIDKAR